MLNVAVLSIVDRGQGPKTARCEAGVVWLPPK